MTRRVVITGAGILSPLGRDLDEYCNALHQGQVAIRAVRYEAPGGTTHRMVAPIDEVPFASYIPATETRFFSQLSTAATWCAERAVEGANLDPASIDGAKAGVILGSGFINLYDLEFVYDKFFTGDERRLSPLVIPINMASCAAGRISMQYGFRGVTRTVSTACASASSALADAWRSIKAGRHSLMLAGGADLVCCTTLVRSWERLRILCPVTDDPALACRPFDRERNGLALGDGAAMFLLEDLEHAEQRGAPILAELRGAYENADGFDMLKPSVDGEIACVEGVLSEAALAADEIDMVQAHGTATALNDATEFSALQRVLGERAAEVPINAIKSMIGHTMGASGAFSVAAAIGSLCHGHIYPVPGFRAADDGTHLRVAATGETMGGVNNVLVNAFGFGGANACLVISKVVH